MPTNCLKLGNRVKFHKIKFHEVKFQKAIVWLAVQEEPANTKLAGKRVIIADSRFGTEVRSTPGKIVKLEGRENQKG